MCDYDVHFPSSVLILVGLELLQSEQNPFLCIDAVYQFLFFFPSKSKGNFLLNSYTTNYIGLSIKAAIESIILDGI